MEPGFYIKGFFAKTTPYRISDTLFFSKWPDEGSKQDDSIDVRFTDGGIGFISMNVRYMLPPNEESLIRLHRTFKNDNSFKLATIEQMAMQAVQLTASMMTAEDSYRNKRPQFIATITDQVMSGLYQTKTVQQVLPDGTRVQAQEPLMSTEGQILRQPRDLDSFGVMITQVNVSDIDYDDRTQEQIDRKREASMAAELAEIETERARQQKLQAEAEGQRLVTIAQYEEEQLKVKAVTEAEKNKEVAEIEAKQQLTVAEIQRQRQEIEVQTAQLEKEAAILRAEGEAEAKRLIIEADGALTQKLEALISIHREWAEAYTKQRPTPDIVIGGGNEAGSGTTTAQTFMDILTTKALQDLQLDLSVK